MKTTSLTLIILCISIFSFASYNPDLGSSKLHYIENNGQWPDEVSYKAELSNGAVFLQNNRITYAFRNTENDNLYHAFNCENSGNCQHSEDLTGIEAVEDIIVDWHAYEVSFPGANANPVLSEHSNVGKYYNYFIGNDESKWAGGNQAFHNIRFEDLYSNIDLSLYSVNSLLKYDFIVKQNGNPNDIIMNYLDVFNLELFNGILKITTSVNEINELQPYAYQNIDGNIVEVVCGFILNGNDVSFTLPNGYNSDYELVIDPVLVAGSYSGSTTENYGWSASFDSQNNIYSGGEGFGTGFPVTTGAYQTTFGGSVNNVITKFNADASSVIYATYLGGSTFDVPNSMFNAANDELIVLSYTQSSDFPISVNAYQSILSGYADAAITRFTNDGTAIIGSTFFGGSEFEASGGRGDIAEKADGSIVILTTTSSTDMPTTPGAFQDTMQGYQSVALAQFNSDFSTLDWATYYGGSETDQGINMHLDINGDIYFTGSTSSIDLPVSSTAWISSISGGQAGYIAKLSSDGSTLLAGTYIGDPAIGGGFSFDSMSFVDQDSNGDVWGYGVMASFPISPGVYTNGGGGNAIMKLSNDLSSLLLSTTYGPDQLTQTAFMIDVCDNVYACGYSANSSDMPITADAYQSTAVGVSDFHLMVLSPDLVNLEYGTFYGSSDWDHNDGGSSRFDKKGVVYQAVCTSASDFPTTPAALYNTDLNPSYDVAVFKFNFEIVNLSAQALIAPTDTGNCVPYTADFENIGFGGNQFIWDFGDGSPQVFTEDASHTFTSWGDFDVTLVAIDSNSCLITDTAFLSVSVSSCSVCPTSINAYNNFVEGCSGESIVLEYDSDIDSLLTVSWTDINGNPVDPDNVIISNDNCAPAEVIYIITAVCILDSTYILTDTANVIVHNDNPELFISTVENDCEIAVIVDPDCIDYISVYYTPPTINPGEEGSWSTLVEEFFGCGPTDITLNYDCPLCAITNLSASVGSCSGTDFMISLNMETEDVSDSFSVIDQDGNDLGSFDYANLPVMVGPFLGDPSLTYTINVMDSADPNCVNSVDVLAPDCLCEITSVSATLEDCDGLGYNVSVDASGLSLADSCYIQVNGAVIGSAFAYADLPVSIGPFDGDGATVLNIDVIDQNDPSCLASTTAGPQACYVCDIENVTLDYTCTSLTNFDVYLSFSGSNLYTITDGSTVWNNVMAGSDIYLGSYPENQNVTISITDELAEDCEYIADPVSLDCDCDSEPGTIMVNSMNVCPEDLSIVDADDFLLEPGQSVYYLYHNQPSVDASDLPDLISDVYTTGSFLVNNGSVIPCGTAVYVTAIGAYENLSMPGFPDYEDFCLTVSNTIPVNFLCPISIDIDESCDTGFGEFTYSFMISGGLPAMVSGETYNVTGDFYNGTGIEMGEMVTVGPLTDLMSYTVNATDANACSSEVTNVVECEKVPIELISFRGTAEESGNMLAWLTATEIENDYFSLYGSTDAINYTLITTVEGAGSTTDSKSYTYLDQNMDSGTHYYKLAQTDYDGTYTEVSVISVERGSNTHTTIDVFPLPVRENLNIFITSEEDSNAVIQIIDASGKQLESIVSPIGLGKSQVSIDFSKYSSGIYLIEILMDDKVYSERIVK